MIGEPGDNQGDVSNYETLPIRRDAPAFAELETKPSIFETGIKVVDSLAPFRRGGKIGLFGGAGVGKTTLIMELINNIAKALGQSFKSRSHKFRQSAMCTWIVN